jgi:phosphoglycolate phosphatase-like HAD superfamily hydrolase
MRNLCILLVVMLCTSCALLPFEIQKTPLKPDEAVVFDIDGTLTPSPFAIFTAREDAAKAVNLFANKGYKIIYLSARVTFFQAGIPNWLKENSFPEGSIHVPQTAEDSSDPAVFKKRILSSYKAKGWKFVAAFGDSSTDFKAYADAGITHVFALQRVGESECQPGKYEKCWSSWSGHDEDINLLTSP